MIGQFVIVRTYSAGVHCGILVATVGDFAELKDARNIHRWRGANSLMELSQEGAAEDFTRISEPVPLLRLPAGVIAIIPCSEKARKNLTRSRWSKS